MVRELATHSMLLSCCLSYNKMFQICFDTRGKGVDFHRAKGRIIFHLPKPVYLSLDVWRVAVLKIICNHSEQKNFGAIFVESNLVQTRMVNGIERPLLYIANLKDNVGSACLCETALHMSFCEIAITEFSTFE